METDIRFDVEPSGLECLGAGEPGDGGQGFEVNMPDISGSDAVEHRPDGRRLTSPIQSRPNPIDRQGKAVGIGVDHRVGMAVNRLMAGATSASRRRRASTIIFGETSRIPARS